MADDALSNTLDAVKPGRSMAEGDVPDALRRRYLTEAGRLGQGLGFYMDATTLVPSFRDRGHRLVATRSDPAAIRDMVAIARHRGWSGVVVRGATGFRREAWLTGQVQGLEVLGYRPTERDLQVLARRHETRTRRRDEEPTGPKARSPQRSPPDPDSTVRARLKVVDAVVRARIVEPSEQARILAAARHRLADLFELGARMDHLTRRGDGTVLRERRR
jgi:hypothetical protein